MTIDENLDERFDLVFKAVVLAFVGLALGMPAGFVIGRNTADTNNLAMERRTDDADHTTSFRTIAVGQDIRTGGQVRLCEDKATGHRFVAMFEGRKLVRIDDLQQRDSAP